MIKEVEVEVSWQPSNRKHYEALGYDFTFRGDIFTVTIDRLPHGSRTIVTAICDYCQREKQVQYKNYCSNCPKCSLYLVNQKIHSDPEFKKKNSESMKQVNKLHGEKIRSVAKSRIGPLHPNWNPDRTNEDRDRRRSQKHVEWAKLVKEKDNYTCSKCNQIGKKLVSHHVYSYDIHKELRYDVDNGITLCYQCHQEFHKVYGKGSNTKNQFEEFLNARRI